MNKKLRIAIAICFFVGAFMFVLMKEYLYAVAFMMVGGVYLYKGVR